MTILVYPPIHPFSGESMQKEVDSWPTAERNFQRIDIEDATRNDPSQSYILFTPRIIKTPEIKDVNDLKKLFTGTTKKHFESKLVTVLSNNSDNLTIGLPMKPVTTQLNHKWSMADTAQLDLGENVTFDKGKAIETLKSMGKRKALGFGKGIADKITGNLAGTLLSQAGLIEYQPQRQYYSGTDPLSLDLAYNFVPENAEESDLIHKIMKSFQYFSTILNPKEASDKSLPFLGRSPAIWRIILPKTMGTEKAQHRIIFNNIYKHMVLTGVSCIYGEGTLWTPFKDGTPNQMKMTLRFSQFFSVQSSEELFGTDFLDSIQNYSGEFTSNGVSDKLKSAVDDAEKRLG